MESKIFQHAKQIIKLEPTIKYFSITWKLHNRCNYDCMYCPAKWHDDFSRTKSLDHLKDLWNEIIDQSKHLNLPYKIYFSGGEVTINKSFKPFIKWLRENYNQRLYGIGLTSNGSASKKYYLDLFKGLDWLTFSTHTEHMDTKKFFDTATELAKVAVIENKSFMINIMDEYWAKDQIILFENICKKNNIFYSKNAINYNYKTREQPIFKNL